MKTPLSLLLAALAGTAMAEEFQFHPAVQLEGGGEPIKLESPGYASPCWADLDGDGHKDLAVGQFRDGKIKIYSGKDGIKMLGAGKWLEANSKVVEIPGVW